MNKVLTNVFESSTGVRILEAGSDLLVDCVNALSDSCVGVKLGLSYKGKNID
jgi:hypothetical protein